MQFLHKLSFNLFKLFILQTTMGLLSNKSARSNSAES